MASEELARLESPALRRGNGLRLAAIRQERGLSLEQIAETTKIGLRFLRAIEAEAFEELPGGIFSTSYLRQYAKCVNCDEQTLLARFQEKMNRPPNGDSREIPKRPPLSETRTRLSRWFRR